MNAGNLAGGNGHRRAMDFYPTPPDVTEALIKELYHTGLAYEGQEVWEPAAGDGDMVRELRRQGLDVHGSDIREGHDFLTMTALLNGAGYQWIITNPPFSAAEPFIRHAMDLTPRVAMLVKAQFFHAAKRIWLFYETRPGLILPLTWRPDFTGRGGSMLDMIWVVWHPEATATEYRPLVRPKRKKGLKHEGVQGI